MTRANLSHLLPQALAAVQATLRGQMLVGADQAVEIRCLLPHGHVVAVVAQAHARGLPALTRARQQGPVSPHAARDGVGIAEQLEARFHRLEVPGGHQDQVRTAVTVIVTRSLASCDKRAFAAESGRVFIDPMTGP